MIQEIEFSPATEAVLGDLNKCLLSSTAEAASRYCGENVHSTRLELAWKIFCRQCVWCTTALVRRLVAESDFATTDDSTSSTLVKLENQLMVFAICNIAALGMNDE